MDYYKSIHSGSEIDDQIDYVKNTVKPKISQIEDDITNLKNNKSNYKDVVKYSEKNIANGYAGLNEDGKVSVLDNVDNTSDADKPVSTAQAAALALKTDNEDFESHVADFAAHKTDAAAHEEAFAAERKRFNPIYCNALFGSAEGVSGATGAVTRTATFSTAPVRERIVEYGGTVTINSDGEGVDGAYSAWFNYQRNLLAISTGTSKVTSNGKAMESGIVYFAAFGQSGQYVNAYPLKNIDGTDFVVAQNKQYQIKLAINPFGKTIDGQPALTYDIYVDGALLAEDIALPRAYETDYAHTGYDMSLTTKLGHATNQTSGTVKTENLYIRPNDLPKVVPEKYTSSSYIISEEDASSEMTWKVKPQYLTAKGVKGVSDNKDFYNCFVLEYQFGAAITGKDFSKIEWYVAETRNAASSFNGTLAYAEELDGKFASGTAMKITFAPESEYNGKFLFARLTPRVGATSKTAAKYKPVLLTTQGTMAISATYFDSNLHKAMDSQTDANVTYTQSNGALTYQYGGASITVNDAVEGTPLALTLYGKCTETLSDSSAEKSPDNPATITGIGESGSVTLTVTDGMANEIAIPLSAPLYKLNLWPRRTDELSGTNIIRRTILEEFDGTEAWYWNGIGSDGLVRYFLANRPSERYTGHMGNICSHFKCNPSYSSNWRVENYAVFYSFNTDSTAWFGVCVSAERFPTVDSFKAWLAEQKAAGTPVRVIHPVAPTETDITDTEAGQALLALAAQNGATITNSDGADMEITYNRDINKALAEINNAIITLGGTI